MKNKVIVLLLVSLLCISSVHNASASSAGDDEEPSSPPSGGGGGGGGPQYFDYFVPLVFGEDHPNGFSEVVVWVIQPSLLITTFDQNDFGQRVSQLREPTKLVFNPKDNNGLTNGSLIRLTAPSLVTGQRTTEDIAKDESFGYTILPKRMMGFEYYAPFDGYVSIFSQNPGSTVSVSDPDGSLVTGEIPATTGQITFEVEKGSYINTTKPSVGAFYTDTEGMSASMAVPRYLHGSEYLIDPDITSPREDEIDRSYISINPSEPTELNILRNDGTINSIDIFGPTKLSLDPSIKGITATRGDLEVNLRIKYSYGGTTRSSTIQLIAAPEMRAAEAFATPAGYSSHFVTVKSDTQYNISRYDYNAQNYTYVTRRNYTRNATESFHYASVSNTQFLYATNYLFGYIVSPGKASHPMAPSSAFLNIPLNSQTQRNITGIKATWYRFANLAVKSVEIIPGPVEEYTGQTIKIEVWSNGSLPASSFRVEIILDDEVVIDETYDFLQVNETITYEIKKFLDFGKQELKLSVDVDADAEVSEIVEEDNSFEENYEVIKNIRLRWTFYGILIVSLLYLAYKVRMWLKQKREVDRAHVDAILTFEEEQE